MGRSTPDSFKSKKAKQTANDLIFNGQDEVLMYIIWSLILSCICACCWRGSARGGRQVERNENNRNNHRIKKRKKQYKIIEKEEQDLENKVKMAESQLAAKQIQRQVLTARIEQENIETELTTLQDERGKALYGDAWDSPIDGSIPIKDLFELNEDELREIKIEAYNRMALEEKNKNNNRGTIHSSRLKSQIIDYKNAISSMKPEERHDSILLTSRIKDLENQDGIFGHNGGSGGGDYKDDDDTTPLILTSRTQTKRSLKPLQKAPYDDPRFVRPRSELPTHQFTNPIANPSHYHQPPNNNNTWVQQAGFRNPLPPPSINSSHDNIWVQEAGLRNPLPPQLPPPPRPSSSTSRSKSQHHKPPRQMDIEEWRERTPRLIPPPSSPSYKNDNVTPRKARIKKSGIV